MYVALSVFKVKKNGLLRSETASVRCLFCGLSGGPNAFQQAVVQIWRLDWLSANVNWKEQ